MRGAFKKGYDPRRVTYQKGDGRRRHAYKKGYDPDRLPNERLQEVNFKKGNTAGANEDGPKVAPDVRVDLIPVEFQVEVSSELTGKELLPLLDDAIQFGMRMMSMIEAGPRLPVVEEVLSNEEPPEPEEQQEALTRKHRESVASVENGLAVGLYTALLDKCIDTRAAIEGGGIKPAQYGRLGEQAVRDMKEELAYLLHCNLTQLNHGLHYAHRHGIFDKSGRITNWANLSYRALLSGIRLTIERRARLDVWERNSNKEDDAIMAAFRETLGAS